MKKDIDENDAPINALPKYKIRSMKDDLAGKGLKELEAEAIKAQEEKPKEVLPPKELPIIEERPIPKPPIKKAPLPGTEELISENIPKPASPKLTRPSFAPALDKTPTDKEITKALKPKDARKKPKLLPVLLIILIVAIALGGILYWKGGKPEPKPEPPIVQEPKLSEPLFPVNQTKILSLESQIPLSGLLKQEVQKEQLIGTFKRIGILKEISPADGQAKFLSLPELFNELKINILPYVLTELKENYTLAVYSQDGKRRLGLIVETENVDNLKEQLKFWEQTMADDLKNFFLMEIPKEQASSGFLDNIYPPLNEPNKQAKIRYINFPESDLTLDYTILNNLFILTTSKESMYKLIDRIVENL